MYQDSIRNNPLLSGLIELSTYDDDYQYENFFEDEKSDNFEYNIFIRIIQNEDEIDDNIYFCF